MLFSDFQLGRFLEQAAVGYVNMNTIKNKFEKLKNRKTEQLLKLRYCVKHGLKLLIIPMKLLVCSGRDSGACTQLHHLNDLP